MHDILKNFGIENFVSKPFGDGHINSTFLIETETGQKYILQKINTLVFRNPEYIANNIALADHHLKIHHPDYYFLQYRNSVANKPFYLNHDQFWRLSDFVPNSYAINLVEIPSFAFDAAAAFGKLTKNLDGVKIENFRATIPNFHNLDFRYHQFQDALRDGNKDRIQECKEQIAYLNHQKSIVDKFLFIENSPEYKYRLLHHDTKINNVLYDKNTQKSLCVCDLDTLMPGKYYSDLGDMIRTYTCSESEESTNFDKITVRHDYYEALMRGYLSELKDEFTKQEKQNLLFAGEVLIYMQALRFLSDYLNNDIYYPIKYEKHNLNRAINQIALLQNLQENREILNDITKAILKL